MFERNLKELKTTAMGIYFTGGDTDKGGVKIEELRLMVLGVIDSPAYWQPAKLGPCSVTPF